MGLPALIKDLAILLSTLALPYKLSCLGCPRLGTWLAGAEMRKMEVEELGHGPGGAEKREVSGTPEAGQ